MAGTGLHNSTKHRIVKGDFRRWPEGGMYVDASVA